MSPRRQASQPRRTRRAWIFVFLALVSAASGWVLLEHVLAKNRILDLGRRQQAIEGEIATLGREIRALNLRVEEASSRKNLMAKLAAARTRLRPIQPGAPIIVPAQRPTAP